MNTDMDNWFVLEEATKVQKKMLDEYRLTTVFRDAYGNYLVDNNPQSNRVKAAIDAIKKATNNENVTVESHRKLIVDMVYTRAVLGLRMWEYLAYGLADRTPQERTAFLPELARYRFYHKLNTNKESIKKLDSKFLTYQTIPQAFKRDIIQVTGPESKREFLDYCEKHERFIVKPNGGSLGAGVKFFSVKDYKNSEKMFSALLKEYRVAEKYTFLCEEAIIQHPFMAQFHEHSVNSVRIFTYFDDVDTHIICAWMKAGKDGIIVDNGGSGGMLAAIDCDTGVICTDARDELSNHYVAHPNSGVVFKGQKVEGWDDMVEAVKEWSRAFPGVRMIGWDVALTEKKGVQLVEGNAWGMLNVLQVATQEGMLRSFTNTVQWPRYK